MSNEERYAIYDLRLGSQLRAHSPIDNRYSIIANPLFLKISAKNNLRNANCNLAQSCPRHHSPIDNRYSIIANPFFLNGFQRQSTCATATITNTCRAFLQSFILQCMNQGNNDSRSRTSKRMTKRNGSSIYVHFTCI